MPTSSAQSQMSYNVVMMKALCFLAVCCFPLAGAKSFNNERAMILLRQQRGGSTSLQLPSSTQNSTISQTSATPEVSQIIRAQELSSSRNKSLLDHESVSVALRLTCEVNRRLRIGTSPTNSWRNDQASIFYTPPSQRTSLSSYVQNLNKNFDCETLPLITAISLIYLDRACSIQTFRPDVYPGDQAPSCPNLTSMNVHKLYLASNILALRTYRNELPMDFSRGAFHDDITHLYLRIIQSSGDDSVKHITAVELGNLLEWMVASLGAEGLAVQVEEVNNFIEHWRDLFEWECESSDKLVI